MAGEIVHIEFSAQDADRAAAFWGGLFGWEFGPSIAPDFEYRMARMSDTSGAAIMSSEERGHPNYYFDTPDIEAAMATVRDLGGTAGEKVVVPTHGWYSSCTDSEGNAFRLWQGDPGAA